jgi:hypothetical protein
MRHSRWEGRVGEPSKVPASPAVVSLAKCPADWKRRHFADGNHAGS